VSLRIPRALTAPIMIILTGAIAPSLVAQSAPSFDVASIRPSPDEFPPKAGGVQITPGQFRASYLSLKDYIGIAYGMRVHQIVAPDWVGSARFEIVAKLPAAATPDQLPQMMQTLLRERFQLRTHRESREFPVYALEVAKDGHALVRVPDDAPSDAPFTVASSGNGTSIAADLGHGSSLTFANNRFEAKKVTMTALADTLSRFVDRPIVDMTKLEGRYDVVFDVAPEDYYPMLIRSAVNAGITLPPQALRLLDNASVDSVPDALRKIGLSLDPRHAPLEVLVVDTVRRAPTEN